MKLGIVLPSFMYSMERKRLASNAFYSLMATENLQQETRLLILAKVGHAVDYAGVLDGLSNKFSLVLKTDEGLSGTEQTLAYGTEWMFASYNVDYVTWMGDDALFHPMWLWKLEGLVKRHPEAKSWSVYRSAYEWFHRTLNDKGDDVLVRSICGHGMTFSKKEWSEWGVDWKKVGNDPEAITLDLQHYEQRHGERWVTKQSFVEHTGKVGVHCNEQTPEFARDFQLV